MAIQTKEKKIGESVYTVTQLPARRALKLKARLVKMFGTSLAQIFLTSQETEEKNPDEMTTDELASQLAISAVDKYKIQDMRKASVVKGVQLLVSNLDEKTFDDLCMELLQGVRKDGMELTAGKIDQDFAGELTTLYAVLLFVLEVNYADFFGWSGIGNLSQGLNPQDQDTKKTYTYK
jgi:hypothetical protein